MSDFTLLTKEQVEGEEKLDVLKEYGIFPKLSDFAAISDFGDERWFTKSNSDYGDVIYVGNGYGNTNLNITSSNNNHYTIRPAIKYNLIEDKCQSISVTQKGFLEVDYGEYPQSAPSKDVQEQLKKAHYEGKLRKTGRLFTTSKILYSEKFIPKHYIEYEYQGKKYIKTEVKTPWMNGYDTTTISGCDYKRGNEIWIEVEPITWIVDEKDNIAITKNLLIGGIPFIYEGNIESAKYYGDFENTGVKEYLDDYFAIEILPKEKQMAINPKKNKIKKASGFYILSESPGSDYYYAETSDFAKVLGCSTGWLTSESDDFHPWRREVIGGTNVDYNERVAGIRPAIWFEEIKAFCNKEKYIKPGVLLVEYGEYPQKVVNDDFQIELEKKYLEGKIEKTEKTYTIPFNGGIKKTEELTYKGKKYVRVKPKFDKVKLSNGTEYEKDKFVWIEVLPIKWVAFDSKYGIALAVDSLLSGISYEDNVDKFLEDHLAEDLLPSNNKLRHEKHKGNERKRPGIKVNTINVEKIEEIISESNMEIKEKSNEVQRKR